MRTMRSVLLLLHWSAILLGSWVLVFVLRLVWALADHAARNCVHLPLDDLPQLDPAAADRALADFKRLRGHLYNQSTNKILAAIFEGVTERVYGRTFALRNLARDPPSLHLESLRCSTLLRELTLL